MQTFHSLVTQTYGSSNFLTEINKVNKKELI